MAGGEEKKPDHLAVGELLEQNPERGAALAYDLYAQGARGIPTGDVSKLQSALRKAMSGLDDGDLGVAMMQCSSVLEVLNARRPGS